MLGGDSGTKEITGSEHPGTSRQALETGLLLRGGNHRRTRLHCDSIMSEEPSPAEHAWMYEMMLAAGSSVSSPVLTTVRHARQGAQQAVRTAPSDVEAAIGANRPGSQLPLFDENPHTCEASPTRDDLLAVQLVDEKPLECGACSQGVPVRDFTPAPSLQP